MPRSIPSPLLSKALEGIGLEIPEQQKWALKSLLHHLTGQLSRSDATADDIARQILTFAYDRGILDIRGDTVRSVTNGESCSEVHHASS